MRPGGAARAEPGFLERTDQGARKKLEAVARYWAGDRNNEEIQTDRNIIDGLIAANAPPDIIAGAERKLATGNDADGCEVWPENWESVTLFLALQTQWTVSPAGRFIGINYPSVESLMNIPGVKKKRRVAMFDDIRLMELAALGVLHEKAERESCRH